MGSRFQPYLVCSNSLIVLVIVNIVALSLATQSWREAQKRAGALAVFYLLPLCTGFTFGLVADIFHMNRHTMAWLHRWLGRICVFHCLLHGTVVINLYRVSSLASATNVARCSNSARYRCPLYDYVYPLVYVFALDGGLT